MTMKFDQISVADWLAARYEELEPLDFYHELFYSCSLAYNPIATLEKEKFTYSPLVRHIIQFIEPVQKETGKPQTGWSKTINVYDGLSELEDCLEWDKQELQENWEYMLTIINPTIYAGKHCLNQNARYLYALVVEVDGIKYKHGEPDGLESLISQATSGFSLPLPTYIVASGSGIHCYYLFDKPIACYKSVQKSLKEFKDHLTRRLWDCSISTLEDKIQYESVFQGFRMVGTRTKYGTITRAFRTGPIVTVASMNEWADRTGGPHIKDVYYNPNSLAICKEKWPTWYEDRIINNKPKGHWTCNRGLYDWWLHKGYDGVSVSTGHRYYFLFCLTIYAIKCDIPYEELEQDAFNLVPIFNRLGGGKKPFLLDDMVSAISNYSTKEEAMFYYPVDWISKMSAIKIESKRRNGRKQSLHLKIARATQEAIWEDRDWRNKDGAPTKEELVKNWRAEHPQGTMYQCTKELGISKNTTRKWW